MGRCSGNSSVNNHHNGIRKKSRGMNLGLQWWRKLTLPRRGKKDTLLQPSHEQLNEEQQERLKERTETLKKSILAGRVTRVKHLCEGEWVTTEEQENYDENNEQGRAVINKIKGNSIQSMGNFIKGKQYLFTEEILFLIDKGNLQMLHYNLPLSIQKTWAYCFSAFNSLSVEEYLTFAFLRRSGFVVRRYTGPKSDYLTPSLSVWRVGAYKRRIQSHSKDQQNFNPTFHVICFSFENYLPYLKDFAKLSTYCQKSRLRISLVDRGVVGFVDVASNATPLSDRYINRLNLEKQSAATKLKNGDLSGVFDKQFINSWYDNN